jgi:DNA repair protein RecO
VEQRRDLAIVLKSVPYEERHRVVTALTENHGKISALARNSIQSRRFGGALEPFAASQWMFVERVGANLFRVEEAQVRRGYEGLRREFELLSLASVFNELMLKMAPEREPCPELFRLHANALAALEDRTEPLDGRTTLAYLISYLSKVMQWSGNQPQISQCMSCERGFDQFPLHQTVSCVVADAGWICGDCRTEQTRHIQDRGHQGFHYSHLRVSPIAIHDFHQGLSAPIRQVPELMKAREEELQSLFGFLEALLEYHVPGFSRASFKSLRFLQTESSVPLPQATPRYDQPGLA